MKYVNRHTTNHTNQTKMHAKELLTTRQVK